MLSKKNDESKLEHQKVVQQERHQDTRKNPCDFQNDTFLLDIHTTNYHRDMVLRKAYAGSHSTGITSTMWTIGRRW